MGRRKRTTRRRRVGAISKREVSSSLVNGAYAVIGAIAGNILGDAINKDKKKYMTSLPQLIVGVGLSLTKNTQARAVGVGMMVPGVQNLLKDFGVSVPGMSGINTAPRLGYTNRLGSMPSPVAQMEMVQG